MLAALVVYIYFPIKMEAIPSKKVKLEEGNLKNEVLITFSLQIVIYCKVTIVFF